jgi:RNA polymerase sigma-70 factor (ECF subfamily)
LSDGVPRAADDRTRAFTVQFQASMRTLWLIAVGIVRDTGLAEDVVQEAAMIALDKLDQFRPDSNFTAWTGQIVRNLALNRARKEYKRRSSLVDPTVLEESLPARYADERCSDVRVDRRGELPIDQPFFDDRVMQALSGLSDVARACLLLRTIEGLEYSRIAVLLDIPEGTAMSHVHRARAYLRGRLANPGSVRTNNQESAT